MLSIYDNDLYAIKGDLRKGYVSLEYLYRLNGVVYYKSLRGRVKGWRAAVFSEFAGALKVHGETHEYGLGVRLSIMIRVLPRINSVADARRAADILLDMPIEDAAFWSVSLNRDRRKAARAFKVMYELR